MQKYQNNVINSLGLPVAKATVTVYNYPSGGPATIYSDNGTTPTSNTLTADANGVFSFYAADGHYSLTITGKGIAQQTISDVLLIDDLAGDYPDSGALTGTESINVRQTGVVKTTLTKIAQWVIQTYQGFTQSGTGAVARTIVSKLGDTVSVRDFGAIGDGALHPLSERFATIASAQAQYPSVPITSLSQSIDWAATQQAVRSRAGGGTVKFPVGTYVFADELLIDVGAVELCGENQGYARSYWAPLSNIPGTRLLFVGAGAKSVKTRRLYRASAGDPNDAPLSTAVNIQNNGVTLRKLTVELYCDYTNAAASNLGDNWDVGVFHGSRLDCRLIDVNVLGYWRVAGIYNDSTRAQNMPELNGYPVTQGAGSDGMSLIRVLTKGYWGLVNLGPLPKAGLMHFGFNYTQAGQFAFSGVPADGDTVTIGTEVYTFRASPVMGTEVQIGDDVPTTIASLIAKWQAQPNRLVPYDALTLTASGSALQVYSTNAVATITAMSVTSANIAVQTLAGGAATGTSAISDPAPFYDSVSGRTYSDGRNSLGASDFVADNSVVYSYLHHSGQAITTANGALGAQNDTCAGAMWIDGLGGSAIIHRQFFINTRFQTSEPYEIKLGFCGRYIQQNCTTDGSPAYGYVVASPTKSATLQVTGYSDPGANFPQGVNQNQVYSHFAMQGYNLTAYNAGVIGTTLTVGGANTNATTGYANIIGGKNANSELRFSFEGNDTVARVRASTSGGITLSSKPSGTGAISNLLFLSSTGSLVYSNHSPATTATYSSGTSSLNWTGVYTAKVVVGSTQVVGAQIAGYGTPTGSSRTASFNGASATLAQTSAQLAQLIVDLKTHGLLGA
jgi:hypothetical protein